jgi:hypothetical protein
MADFTVRIELHDAQWSDYEGLRAAMTEAAVTDQPRRSRLLRGLTTAVGMLACKPPSAIPFNSRHRSVAVCHRSSGSFARQVLTTRSSVGGVMG